MTTILVLLMLAFTARKLMGYLRNNSSSVMDAATFLKRMLTKK